jgi:HlyD family secretion protein
LDLQISQNSLEKKKVALKDLETQLADYVIRPPFAGIVAKVSVKKGDTISTGTALATFITKQKVAEITLNEVDAAKIKLGQKTILTFDALEELTVAGEVSEMGTIGTVTQGVVSYDAKIGFDAQDERVKPGMSVSAVIITQVKQDVLLVPNAAVKEQNSTSYVEILDSSNQVQVQAVEVGLSNDTSTEIVSGLKEGDKVVTQTITGSTSGSTSASQKSSSLQIPGITGGGPAGGFGR